LPADLSRPLPLTPIGAVILAAGGGSRFAGPAYKLTARLGDGSTLAGRAARTALDAGVGPVAVVVGAVAVDDLGLPDEVTVLVNERWADGQSTSLAHGVAWARTEGFRAIVIGLGDQPGLTTGAWTAVAAADATPIATATYAGRRAHPVRLGAEVWDELAVDGDEGARTLMRARPDLVTEVPCDGDPTDIDTVEDLAAWTFGADRGAKAPCRDSWQRG